MKRFIMFLASFVFCMLVKAQQPQAQQPQAQQPQAQQPQPAQLVAQLVQPTQPAQPEITFVAFEWNVGKFSKKETPLRGAVYPFTNTGNAPLVVNDVAPKCGCLRVDWIRTPVPPGGKGWVKVIYNGYQQLPHYFKKNAVVHTNAPNGQFVWLALEGEMTK